MTAPIAPASTGTSTRPYLIRALHDWCTDNGFTPYIAVFVDEHVQVPKEYVKNNEIVLNVGFEATSALKLGNDLIEFKARFGGTSREIAVPIDHVIAIYARENGQGMAFPMPAEATTSSDPAEGPNADAPAASSRGPRLAGSTATTGKKGGALTLSPTPGVPARPTSSAESPAEPPPTPPSPSSGPKRPSLKRVK
jgi:stringent starvation protein B